MTGKVFELLGLGAPILLLAPPGSDVEAILETAGLGRRFSGHDIEGIASFLIGALRGQAPKPKDREAYAWTSIATKMNAILRAAIRPAL